MDCFSTYFTHAQTCDNVRVHSATQRTASVHTLHARIFSHVLPNVNKVFMSILYTVSTVSVGCGCSGTYFTHAQTCDNVCVQSATQRTASVHTLHMPKPVITFVFEVLRKGLLRHILHTCPNLWLRSCSKCDAMDCFGTYTCPNLW